MELNDDTTEKTTDTVTAQKLIIICRKKIVKKLRINRLSNLSLSIRLDLKKVNNFLNHIRTTLKYTSRLIEQHEQN